MVFNSSSCLHTTKLTLPVRPNRARNQRREELLTRDNSHCKISVSIIGNKFMIKGNTNKKGKGVGKLLFIVSKTSSKILDSSTIDTVRTTTKLKK